MKYKTLFRLLLKLLGVWFFVQGLDRILWAVVAYFQAFTGNRMYEYTWAHTAGALISLVAGFYLFFRGNWILDRAIPSNRPYCPECGYDLTGNASVRCSECGIALPDRKTLMTPMTEMPPGDGKWP